MTLAPRNNNVVIDTNNEIIDKVIREVFLDLCNKISANGIFIAIEAAAIFLFPVKPFIPH